MLRALVVVLLLANAAVLAWNLGMLDGPLGRRPHADREPERLQRQVNPELVKLLPAPGASAPAAAASPVTAASSPVMAVAAGAAPVCLEAGPFPAAALPLAEKSLLAAGIRAGSWSTTATERKGVFLIYMGRYEDDETLQRKLEELKRRRIEAQPVRHAELQPGIEVGRFDDKDEAEATLARLAQRGLRTARVLTLVPPQAQLMLRLAAVEPGQSQGLRALKLTPTVTGFVACTADAASAPPARPITAATSATAASPAAVPAALGSAARPAASRPRSGTSGSGTAAGGANAPASATASPAARGAAPGSAASGL